MTDDDPRSAERLRHHFEVERELADRLRRSTLEQRTSGLYTEVYNELFERVPDHPLRNKGYDKRAEVDGQLRLLSRYLRPTSRFLEVGAGDCAVTLRVAEHVREAVAVEVCDNVGPSVPRPGNFRLVITDGVRVPLPDRCVDVAYSHQFMEHLHPDDAVLQLKDLRRVMAPSGVYLCVTPNRLTGPHDVSAHFGEVASGFHLKEYVYGEVVPMLRTAGFARARVILSRRGRVLELPPEPFALLERLASWTRPRTGPGRLRDSRIAQGLLGISVAAYV